MRMMSYEEPTSQPDEDLIPYYKCRVCGHGTCKGDAFNIEGRSCTCLDCNHTISLHNSAISTVQLQERLDQVIVAITKQVNDVITRLEILERRFNKHTGITHPEMRS